MHAFIHSFISRSTQISSACYYDQQQFCQGLQPGDGGVYDCLEEHLYELSNVRIRRSHCYQKLTST
jgi:hypothetical protein